jgi:hypothetical protein
LAKLLSVEVIELDPESSIREPWLAMGTKAEEDWMITDG